MPFVRLGGYNLFLLCILTMFIYHISDAWGVQVWEPSNCQIIVIYIYICIFICLRMNRFRIAGNASVASIPHDALFSVWENATQVLSIQSLDAITGAATCELGRISRRVRGPWGSAPLLPSCAFARSQRDLLQGLRASSGHLNIWSLDLWVWCCQKRSKHLQ